MDTEEVMTKQHGSICFHRKSRRYIAVLGFGGHRYSLGYHNTPEEARAACAAAYKSLAETGELPPRVRKKAEPRDPVKKAQ
jgi:hypothetical protein